MSPTFVALVALLAVAPRATAQTTVVHDTFTGANGTSLTSHAPDTAPSGAAWTYYAGAVPKLWNGALLSNASGPVNGSGLETSVIQSNLWDGVVGADFKPSVTPTIFGLTVRATDASHFLPVRYNSTGSTPKLDLFQFNGSWSLLVSVNAPLLNTNWHRLEARLAGTSVKTTTETRRGSACHPHQARRQSGERVG